MMKFLKAETNNDDGDYFKSYGDLDVHKLMLEDTVRNEAYKNAIFCNQELFKGKLIMDVGAGTGILSILCAQAGAKKVYAVEASDLASLSEEVIKDNKVSSIVEVIHGRIEDIELPDEEHVDIIVSEWMGFYLVHEGMLDSVLVARDRFLKPSGMLFPATVELWCAPCTVPQAFSFWDDVHGVNLSAVGHRYRESKSGCPEIMTVEKEYILSTPSLIAHIDLASVQVTALDELSARQLTVVTQPGKYQGLCLWFMCHFPSGIKLSTMPGDPATHWKQTVVILPEEVPVEEKQPLAWKIDLSRSKVNQRHYDIKLEMLDAEQEKHPTPCTCYMTKCIVIKAFLEQQGDETEDFAHESSEDYNESGSEDLDTHQADGCSIKTEEKHEKKLNKLQTFQSEVLEQQWSFTA